MIGAFLPGRRPKGEVMMEEENKSLNDEKRKEHLDLACQIFGIVAIVYAAQVKSKYDMGQYEKAVKYSENAALWCKLGIAFGLVWLTFYSAIMPFIEVMSL